MKTNKHFYTHTVQAVVAALSVFIGATESNAMDLQKTQLDNGMTVIVVEDHRSPVVVHSIWYHVGSIDEKEPKTGLSHMLEHLMFKDTTHRTNDARQKMIQRNGAQENAFTSRDYTAYYQKVAKDRLALMMEQEADRMVNLTLTDEVFQPERKVVMEERQLRTEGKPVNRFYEKLIQKHYGMHPYAHPVIGWREDIAGYTLEDALNWYKTYYAPNNATLILVGDVTLDEVLPMVQKYYGPLPSAQTPQREVTPQPLRDEELRFVETDSDVQVPLWVRFYRTPTSQALIAGAQGRMADAAALEVLSDIVGGGQTARLYQKLVTELQIADSASAGYDELGAGEGSFDVYVQPKPEVRLHDIETAVESVLENVKKHGVTSDEVQRSVMALKSGDVYAQDDLFNSAYRLGVWLMAGGTVEDFDAYLDHIVAVTPEDVQRVAQEYLQTVRATTGELVAEEAQL